MAIPFIPILLKLVSPLVKLGGYALAAFHLIGVGKRKVKLEAAEDALEQVQEVDDAVSDLTDPEQRERLRKRFQRD